MNLEARIEAALKSPVRRIVPLHGGDLSKVYLAELADGQRIVAKTGATVGTEARMLQAMHAAGAPTPAVLHSEAGLILMEYFEEMPPGSEGWHTLGAALRGLHDNTGTQYGWPEDYAFGSVTIPNSETGNWPQFWAEHRLMAAPDGIPPDLRRRVEQLAQHLHQLLPGTPPPAFLHGDLWSGNVLFHGDGGAALIDPACYYGDAEVDLAMLNLFGTPPEAFQEGYGEIPQGHLTRRYVYQLWPALVHLRLFGAGYRGLVTRLLGRLGF